MGADVHGMRGSSSEDYKAVIWLTTALKQINQRLKNKRRNFGKSDDMQQPQTADFKSFTTSAYITR